jgi:prephenate dehydrogenase
MCGSERAGISAADPDLFRGADWMLARRSPRLERLVRALGARPLVMSPAAHDARVALTSHLPYAFALLLSRRAGRRPRLAAGSFHSATRVAAQSPEMGLDLLTTNAFNLAREAERMGREMTRLARKLRTHDEPFLARLVRAGRR